MCNISLYQQTPFGKPILNPAIGQVYGNAASVEINLTTGELDADWGAGETTSFYLCPHCFEEILRPWLEIEGAKPEITSWSY